MDRQRAVNFCLLSLLLSAGFLLRTYKWSSYSFWYDETLFLSVSKNFANIKDGCIFLLRPPLFPLFLFFWQQISTNEFILRFPSAVFGIASILLTFKVTKLLFNDRVALIAAFLLTFSPLHIYYAQELNYYTLTVLFSLASMYFLILSLQKNERHFWLKYIAWTVICVYTSYLCLYLLLSQNIILVLSSFRDRRFINKWLVSQSIIITLSLPVLFFILGSLSMMAKFNDIALHWFPQGSWEYVIQTFNVFNLGYNATIAASMIGFFALFSLFLYGIIKNLEEKPVLFLLLLWLFIPVITSLALGKFFHLNTYTHRNFIYSSIPYYMLIASSIGRLRNKYLIPALLALSFLFCGSLINYYGNVFFVPEEGFRPGVHLKADHREASQYIVANFEEGDTIIHVCRSSDLPFFYYASFSKKKPVRELIEDYYKSHLARNKDEIKDLIGDYLANKSHLIRNKNEIKGLAAGHKRLWFVFSHWEPETLASADSEERKIKLSLDQAYPLIKKERFEGLEVYLYDIKDRDGKK